MTENNTDETELSEAHVAALGALLSGESIWAEPDPAVEDRVLAAIEAETGPVDGLSASRPGVADRKHLRVIGIAAAVLLTLGVGIGLLFAGDDTSVQVALVGTDLAPGASAVADLTETPQGLLVQLDVVGLPPAQSGTYYQAWVRNSDGAAVTIGTFHMRGGDAQVELWGGVTSAQYPIITVTLQQEGAGAQSSGEVVLKGRVNP